MKQLSIFAMILFYTSLALAQQSEPVPAASNISTSGNFSFENGLAHDFGKIPKDQPVSCTFEFTNSSTDTVRITNAKSGCSCTVPEFTKAPILPGKKAKVKVTYDADFPGNFSKGVTVITDKGDTLILIISGEVIK